MIKKLFSSWLIYFAFIASSMFTGNLQAIYSLCYQTTQVENASLLSNGLGQADLISELVNTGSQEERYYTGDNPGIDSWLKVSTNSSTSGLSSDIKSWDVLITEIMADPNPPVGLPDEEYLELYNRTSSDINLAGWSLTIGGKKKIIQNARIPANGYLILSNPSATSQFSFYGDCIGVTGLVLNNSGNDIVLKNSTGQVIHAVTYRDTWYKDESKDQGGWSLEMIDFQNPCGEEANWAASRDPKGGTPGKANSVIALNPDKFFPVTHVGVPDSLHLLLHFSESMDSLSLMSVNNYFVSTMGQPLAVQMRYPDYRSARLLLPEPLKPGLTYSVLILGKLTDCSGNQVSDNQEIKVLIPGKAVEEDIVINEVLFNPRIGGADFVEIYNRSSKTLDLKELSISHYDTILNVISDKSDISPESWLIFPGEYYVLTTDTSSVKRFYYTKNPGGFIQLSAMPSMNNDEGSIALLSKSGTLIDQFAYNISMHSPLLTTIEGVSLERISPDWPSNQAQNWQSASSTAGFATPAYKNSQFSDWSTNIDYQITISPPIFSPDNDGHNDLLNISCSFPEPGYVASIRIFDALGSLVRILVNNEQLGTTGIFTWDGLTDDRQKALIGRYIIWIEVFNLDGRVRHFKKTAVLGGKI